MDTSDTCSFLPNVSQVSCKVWFNLLSQIRFSTVNLQRVFLETDPDGKNQKVGSKGGSCQ